MLLLHRPEARSFNVEDLVQRVRGQTDPRAEDAGPVMASWIGIVIAPIAIVIAQIGHHDHPAARCCMLTRSDLEEPLDTTQRRRDLYRWLGTWGTRLRDNFTLDVIAEDATVRDAPWETARREDQDGPLRHDLGARSVRRRIGIVVPTTGLEAIRVVAKPKEAECVIDPANEIVLMAPFCVIPG